MGIYIYNENIKKKYKYFIKKKFFIFCMCTKCIYNNSIYIRYIVLQYGKYKKNKKKSHTC